ncbi:hypothetical protein R1flu_021509 [Riccia fluitans]|uniref:Armadillo repeat-containing protein 7 n=1 Tax=Riccia fluitans TaxID=41844 RepID=A0ABD1ZRC1_9MARC
MACTAVPYRHRHLPGASSRQLMVKDGQHCRYTSSPTLPPSVESAKKTLRSMQRGAPEGASSKYGTPRLEYLQQLVTEFQQTVSEEAKEQIVAHLANFGYDPLNYDYLQHLHVQDLFLDCLTEPNEKLVEFAVGGISNCCPDPANAAVIVSSGGIPLLISCLSSPVENMVLSTVISLYYLCTLSTRKEILIPQVIEAIRAYAASVANCRFRNIATAFLGRYKLYLEERSSVKAGSWTKTAMP